MNGLTTELLSQACTVFMTLAYPEGEAGVSPARQAFFALPPDRPLAEVLASRGVCEPLLTPAGQIRGYAFRLGSAQFPHLKLQVVDCHSGRGCVFAVDTHDALRCPASPAEAPAWARLQIENRRLKEAIEQEWERRGLLTFNGLLRLELQKQP
jgi:hypothetical protein